MHTKPTHAFVDQAPLFKAYDIRGQAALFTDDFLLTLGSGFAQHYHHTYQNQPLSVVIGYDVRPSSPIIAQCLAHALQSHGIDVLWLGLCSTPMMAYLAQIHQGAGIIATASHSPKDIAGIKWLTHHASPSSDDIQALYATLTTSSNPTTKKGQITQLQHQFCADRYIKSLHHLKTPAPLFDTVVVDCLHGATGAIAKAALAPLVNQLIVLNDTPDGQFPKGNPDPAEPMRLTELSAAVLANQAELGLAFDGDGDRLGVVDATGKVLSFDDLLYLLALASHNDKSKPGKVLFDIKCLHTLPALLHQANIEAVMTKTGSSHLRRALQRTHKDATFAGELSGHFIFNDCDQTRHDDGIYAAIRLMHWLSMHKYSLHKICSHLPKPIATPDIYLPLSAALAQYIYPSDFIQALCHVAQANGHNQSVTTITLLDGLRVDFAYGFGLMRSSNTSNNLSLRFAGNDSAGLAHICAYFYQLINDASSSLKVPPQDLYAFSDTVRQVIQRSIEAC